MSIVNATFLGTGTSQGVPVITCECEVCRSDNPHDRRLRSSILIQVDDLNIVIDAGPDFRQQMLRVGLKRLDAVLLTHAHKDHTGGLDDVRAYNYRQRSAVDVYGMRYVLDALRTEFSYAFEHDKYPGVPEINLREIENHEFSIKGMKILPVEVQHYHLPVFGFRIGNLVYITDASNINPKEIDKITGCDVLIVNALRKKKHYSHFNLEEALGLVDRVGAERAYLTHISHMMGRKEDVEKELPPHVRLAYDGLQLTV